MLFFTKKEEKREVRDDSDTLKDFVNDDVYQPVSEEPYPNVDNLQNPDSADFFLKKPVPQPEDMPVEKRVEKYAYPDDFQIVEKSVEPVRMEDIKKPAATPLFVKVEKYNEIMDSLQQTKALMAGIRGVFPLLVEVENVRKDALDTLRVTMQKVEKNLVLLDSEFSRPGTPNLMPRESLEGKHVEDSLGQLQSNLISLRSELEKMKQ